MELRVFCFENCCCLNIICTGDLLTISETNLPTGSGMGLEVARGNPLAFSLLRQIHFNKLTKPL